MYEVDYNEIIRSHDQMNFEPAIMYSDYMFSKAYKPFHSFICLKYSSLSYLDPWQ
jgi:hypothetical protein